ncbi:MAG TPA: prealbumin-like fold domain-containing protein [Candidatus Limnocylindria bacterium]|nr:prealbumin-like fold domain-containing protein [Candidatus Limnocylindria bacterium]
MTRRFSRTLGAASVATVLLAMSVSAALGWTKPSLGAECAPDADSYAWTITLTQEPDYLIQFSWTADFADTWTVNFGSAGMHSFTTDRDGSTLYARWKNDKAKQDSEAANGDLCRNPDDAALNIHKRDENGAKLAGAVFTVEGLEGTYTTDEDGEVCITGLPDDSEWLVTEIQAPAGYELADPNWQMVEVDDDGDCDSPDAVFVNAKSTPTPTPTPTPTATPTPTPTPTATPTPTPTPSENESPSTPTPTATPREGELGGTPTPAPQLPDTALTAEESPSPAPLVIQALVVVFMASVVGVTAVRRR